MPIRTRSVVEIKQPANAFQTKLRNFEKVHLDCSMDQLIHGKYKGPYAGVNIDVLQPFD